MVPDLMAAVRAEGAELALVLGAAQKIDLILSLLSGGS
jgi:hypothetical protein